MDVPNLVINYSSIVDIEENADGSDLLTPVKSPSLVTEEELLLSSSDNSFSKAPNFLWIEVALLSNVFLAGFDSTVTASIYTTIGNEFNATNMASWITTSYLITSTAFQPLYGSFSDVIGRRKCCFFASMMFGLGCLGCALAPDMFTLNLMRALTGLGGGGLITLSTIINSDIITPRKRGLFQAIQNILVGMGAVSGASFGGAIASKFGWRWCFLCQIAPSMLSIFVGYKYIKNQPDFENHSATIFDKAILEQIDIRGSVILVIALTLQIVFLTLGCDYGWTNPKVLTPGIIGFALGAYFIHIEYNTDSTNPIIPIKRYKNMFSFLLLGQNFFIGLSTFAYLFTLPLLFQIVLHDTPSRAGLRLAVPSLSTPIGGVITGVLMNKYGCLKILVFSGTLCMTVGNYMALLVSPGLSSWVIDLLLMPANIGQGMAYPSTLFSFIFAYGNAHQATSTSTIYLMRSIGGVWGVSAVSSIIQTYLKYKVRLDLSNLTDLDAHSIAKIVDKISRSTDKIYSLPAQYKEIVLMDYEQAIRFAQLFSCLSCTLGLIFCIVRDVSKSKTQVRPPGH